MANYANLKAAISQAIKTNGNQEITGQVLQDVLNSIVSVIGANYTFAGVATPATNPGTPDQNVVYLAMEGGTYTNFNAMVLPAGISLLMWNGTWTSETVMYGDGGVFDISVYKSSGGTLATFADLAAALDGGNNIPASARKGGMSVKFIQGTAQSSDNTYVQCRYMSSSTAVADFTNILNWIKTDIAHIIYNDSNFASVVIDKNNKISEATDKQGNKYFFGETIFKDGTKGEEKVDKEKGKTLIDENIANSLIYNDSNFASVVIDKNNKISHAIDVLGQHYFYAGIQIPTIKDFTGKTILFFGDSITDITNVPETKYPNYVCKKLFANQENYAVSASGFSMNTNNSSHPKWGKKNTSVYKMIERAHNAGISADLIIVAAGTNDWYFGTTKGSFSDINEPTMELKQSFYWHVNKAITNLLDFYPTVPYLFITPLPRRGDGVTQHTERENGTLIEFAEIIKELCNYYSLPVLDMMNNSNMHLENSIARTLYTLDGLHPTQFYSENIYSNIIINKIKQIIF